MVEDRIGYRYAKSIFDLAKEKKVLDEVKGDMEVIRDTVQGSRELSLLLNSPLVSSLKKKTVIAKIFDKGLETDMSKYLVDIIASKGREKYIPHIAQGFLDLYDKEHRVLRGVLTSATKVPAATAKKIKAEVEKQLNTTFEMDQEVDPELIGGFTLKVGDKLFDGSVASSLRKLKRSLLQ